jgi:glycosyltransferase involved in cell wall biosynthesis
VLGLRPYVNNVVLAPSTDCAHPADVAVELIDLSDLRRPLSCHALALYLREKYPSIRLVMGHMGNGTRLSKQIAEMLGVPLLGTFGGSDVNVEMLDPTLRQAYLELLALPSAHYLTVAGYLRDKLLNEGAPPSRLFTWHRGANLDDFQLVTRTPGPVTRVVVSARFYEVKGHEYVIRAVASLRGRGRPVELILLGDGPLRAQLMALTSQLGVTDAVKFIGHVSHESVLEHLGTADIYVHPSVTCGEGRIEGVPNAIMEAAATGMPVVATDHGGINEVVLDGQTGFLVPERDADALADRIARLVDDRELRLRMGLRGRAHIEQEFNLRVQSRRLAGRILQTIQAAELFEQRGWSLQRVPVQPDSKNVVQAPRQKITLDGDKLYEAMKDPPFKVGGKAAIMYKKTVWNTVFRPYLKFIGREIGRFVSKELSEQLATLLTASARKPSVLPPAGAYPRADGSRRELLMSSALCLDCPHCDASVQWPDEPCPLDRACLETLAREFVPLDRLRNRTPRNAVVLEDGDVGTGERLAYVDGSLPAVHYRGDLQRVTDVSRFFRELRRIIAPDGELTVEIDPMPLGRDGARLHGDLAIPFAQQFFSPSVLASHLGVAIREPRRFDPDELRSWFAAAGLAVVEEHRPNRLEDPCEMHVQARFAALFRRTGLGRDQLVGTFVARLKPAAVAAVRAEPLRDAR